MKVYAGLHFDGPDLEPDDVTRATELTPDWAYPRDQRLPSGRLRGHGSWSIHSQQTSPRQRTEDAIDDLLAVATPAWPALVDLGARYEAQICLVVTVESEDEGYPPMFIRRDQLERLAELRASIDVDDYDDRVMLPARARPHGAETPRRLT